MEKKEAREYEVEPGEEVGGGKRGLWETVKKAGSILMILALFISVGGNIFMVVKYYEKRDEYDALADVHAEEYFVFPSLTVDGFKDKVASGEEFVALISRPNCGSCRRVSSDFIAFCEELGIQNKIYHLNVVYLRKDLSIPENLEEWNNFKEIYGLTGTPTYARYSNGEVISVLSWTEENGLTIEMAKEWIYEQGDYFQMTNQPAG